MLKHLRKREDFGQKNLLEKGFTLVELLVVIVILGILAAVVVFAVGGSTDKAQSSSCKTQESTIESAVEAYRAQAGSYPTDMKDMISTANGGNEDPSNTDQAALIFLKSVPDNYVLAAGGTVNLKPNATGYTNPCA